MNLHTTARLAGLVGGLFWLVRLVMDPGGSGSGVTLLGLQVGGGVLLFVAMVATGAGVVGSDLVWLRAIVGIALPLLIWSILEVLHENANDTLVDGVFGFGVAALSVWQLSHSRSPKTGHRRQKSQKRPRAGSHAR